MSEIVKETSELREVEDGMWVHEMCAPLLLYCSTAAPDTMYMYEGKDYSKASELDRKTFDQLLAGI